MEHTLTANGLRRVKSELTINDDGRIEKEEISSIGGPQHFTEEYKCSCGKKFDVYTKAAEHVISERNDA